MAFAERISETRIPRVDWCCTCDKQIGKAMEPKEDIGPHHHTEAFPDHYVVSVTGEFYVWRTE